MHIYVENSIERRPQKTVQNQKKKIRLSLIQDAPEISWQ